MGIFYSPKIKSILEVEINGEKQEEETDDYTTDTETAGDDNTDTSETPTSTEDNDEGYTAGADGSGDEDDYTADVDSAGDDNDSEEETSTEDTGEDDYTSGADTAGDEDSDTSDEEETDDYTADASGDGSEEESEDTDTDDGEENTDEETEDDSSFENLKKIESELFSSLTPEQITIKNYELKQNFISLYATIGTTLVRINDISKSDDNIETLKFITDKLLELREMIDFNITTAYDTRTFIENNIIYQQCLSTLNAISDIIASIPSPINKDEDEEYTDNIVDDLEDSENKETSQEINIGDKMIENTSYYNDYI
jgi:hypothetical protein